MGDESVWDNLQDVGEGALNAIGAVGDAVEAQLDTAAATAQAGVDWADDSWHDVSSAAVDVGQAAADAVGEGEQTFDDALPERSRPGPFPF